MRAFQFYFVISDHVLNTLPFADKTSNINYKKDTVIQNPQVIRDIVKISGYRYKIVAPPDQDITEEEVNFN